MLNNYNPIETSNIINPENTPEIFKLFSMVHFRVDKKTVVLTISEIEKMLEEKGVDHSEMDTDTASNVFKMCYPNYKWYGYLAYETYNTVHVWFDRIAIYKKDRSFGKINDSEINWSAIGSVDAETAKTMAELLKEAAYISQRFNEENIFASF